MKLFPTEVGITELRGIISIIRDNGGKISLPQLSNEAEEDIDRLLPLLEAGSLLGLMKIEGANVALTEQGKGLNPENMAKILSNALAKIEPFKTAMKILKEKGSLTTRDLVRSLRKMRVKIYTDEALDIEAMRKLLLRWGVRSKMFSYDYNTDTWSLPS
ncbi:MAG: AAA-associated domain-containing protein [Candidatus Micrarchaeia archaeon]